jgi:hypothetical protein
VFAILAIVCFLLDTFNSSWPVNRLALGLAFLAAQLLLGRGLLGDLPWGRREVT